MSSTDHTARSYRTLTPRGLDFRLPPMVLWRKAKAMGTWDPAGIDFTADAEQWRGLAPEEREILLNLTSLFQAGEESVTLDLLPLILVIAREGRLEEEMYLTSFLWEEAKHVEAFQRFFEAVVEPAERENLERFETPSYRQMFHHELPQALGRLGTDASPAAQAEASVTYNMIVEGVLAETGYHAYEQMLRRNDLLPGMQKVIGHLKNDESRHLAYGVFLLSRLVAEHGEPIWQTIEQRMSTLLPLAIGNINELFARYENPPFGLDLDDFVTFAMGQFQRRFQRIEKARRQTLEEVCRIAVDTPDGDTP